MKTLSFPRLSISPSCLLTMTLAFGLGGCVLDGVVGEDPEAASATEGMDSGPIPDTVGDTTTTGEVPPDASASATSGVPPTETSWGDSGPVTTGGPGEPLDPEAALEFCDVPAEPPAPGAPEYFEGIECAGGCTIDLVLAEPIDLFQWGECLCAAMQCGELIGGGTTGPAPDGDTDTVGDTTEGADGCGPFPPGGGMLVCNCEMCSIDVNDIDFEWLDNEADPDAICECMCGVTGCGAPVPQ